jgi:hypothetical protein
LPEHLHITTTRALLMNLSHCDFRRPRRRSLMLLPLMLVALGLGIASSAVSHAADEEQGFIDLWDGKSLDGWMNKKGQPAQFGGWMIHEGSLHLRAGSLAGDLITQKEFGDFILDWEWKIASGGNNGIKYRVRDFGKERWLGPEYQMIDDDSKAAEKPYFKTAAVYNILEPAADKPLKPPGEWNKSRIIAKGTKLEHYLNGVKVAEIDTASDEWKSRKAASKFAKWEGFGEGKGRIMLTDHVDATWYRSIRIKPLD